MSNVLKVEILLEGGYRIQFRGDGVSLAKGILAEGVDMYE
jgi:hypothetical protein